MGIIIIFHIFTLNNSLAQADFIYSEMFDQLNTANITTAVLIDKSVPDYVFQYYNGNNLNDIVQSADWYQAYNDIYHAQVSPAPALPNIMDPKLASQSLVAGGTVPIGLINYKYQKIKDNALQDGLLQMANNKLYDVQGASPYAINRCFAASILPRDTIRGSNFQFIIPTDLFYTNTPENIISFDIDFDEGITRTGKYFNQVINVTYTEYDEKDIVVTAHLLGGGTLKCKTKILVGNPGNLKSGTGHGSYDGSPVTKTTNYTWEGKQRVYKATYYKYLSCNKLRKPFIMVESFDPNNARGLERLYQDLDAKNNFVSELKNNNYDVILVTWEDGGAPIQANADLLEQILEELWGEMTSNGYFNEFVLIGPSMGGLITRYTLASMEDRGENHHTRLWISIDAPHQGAYLPLSVISIINSLYSLNKLLGDEPLVGKGEAENLYNMYNCPAAQQMAIYHSDGLDNENGKAGPDPDFTALFNEYGNMPNGGYPSKCKKIAIAWGAGNGTGQVDGNSNPYYPGDIRLNASGTLNDKWGYFFAFRAPGDQELVPVFEIGAKTQVDVNIECGEKLSGLNKWPTKWLYSELMYHCTNLNEISFQFDPSTYMAYDNTEPYENAPGGQWSIMEKLKKAIDGQLGGNLPDPGNDCFIPTISALDVSNVELDEDLHQYYNIFSGAYYKEINSPNCPFDVIYADDANKYHHGEAFNIEQVNLVRDYTTINSVAVNGQINGETIKHAANTIHVENFTASGNSRVILNSDEGVEIGNNVTIGQGTSMTISVTGNCP